MLPASVAIDRARLQLDPDRYLGVSFEPMGGLLRAVVGSTAEAITLGNRVFVKDEVFEAIVEGARPDLVAHELAHVDQWRDHGISFLVRYVGEYVRFRILGVPHDAAYRAISYEVAAATAERLAPERLRT